MVARDKSRLMTPGPTQAVRFSTSMSAIRFMRVVTSTTPPTSGTAPADRPVPAPPGHHRNPVPSGGLYYRRGLLGGLDHRHHCGVSPIYTGILAVDMALQGGIHHTILSKHTDEFLVESGVGRGERGGHTRPRITMAPTFPPTRVCFSDAGNLPAHSQPKRHEIRGGHPGGRPGHLSGWR